MAFATEQRIALGELTDRGACRGRFVRFERHVAFHDAASSVRNRTKLYAATRKVNIQFTSASPR